MNKLQGSSLSKRLEKTSPQNAPKLPTLVPPEEQNSAWTNYLQTEIQVCWCPGCLFPRSRSKREETFLHFAKRCLFCTTDFFHSINDFQVPVWKRRRNTYPRRLCIQRRDITPGKVTWCPFLLLALLPAAWPNCTSHLSVTVRLSALGHSFSHYIWLISFNSYYIVL